MMTGQLRMMITPITPATLLYSRLSNRYVGTTAISAST